jgi:Uma2 family endonuclease
MAVAERVGMPLSDFIAETNERMFELINGERQYIMPTVAAHNESMDGLYMLLRRHVDDHDLGFARNEATFILPDAHDSNGVTGSRTPDILFITKDRIVAYRAEHPNWRDKPYMIVPDFVVEIISPNDKFSDIYEKVDAYLRDGVRLVWIIDPQARKAFVYTPDGDTERIAEDGLLDADEVVTGFKVKLADVLK